MDNRANNFFLILTGAFMQSQALSATTADSVTILMSTHGMPAYTETAGAQELSTINLAVLSQLMVLDEGFTAHPYLLSDAHFDYARNVYVLSLKDGLRFQNGRLATSKDLEFSLVRGFFSPNKSFYKTYIGNIEGIESVVGQPYRSGAVSGVRVIDGSTVEIKLISPNPSFLPSLVNPFFSLVPQEELDETLLTWKKYPIGVGPYRVQPSGFHDGHVTIEKIDPSAKGPRAISIYSADVLSHYDISILSAEKVQHSADIQRDLAGAVTTIFLSNIHPLASNPHFRRAVSLLVDRAKLAAGVKGSTPTHEMLPRRFWGLTAEKDTHDLEAAKKEVAQIPTSLVRGRWEFSVYIGGNSSPETDFINEELKKEFAAVGLNVEAKFTKEKFIDENAAKTYPFFIMSRISDYIDPLIMFSSMRKGGHDPFLAPIDGAEFDRLYLEASLAKIHEDRVASMKKLSKYVTENVVCVPLLERRYYIYADKSKIKSLGEQRSPIVLDVRNIEQ